MARIEYPVAVTEDEYQPKSYNQYRSGVIQKARKLRSLARLGANAQSLHLYAMALADFDSASADELHAIASRIERAFGEMELPRLTY